MTLTAMHINAEADSCTPRPSALAAIMGTKTATCSVAAPMAAPATLRTERGQRRFWSA